MLVKPLVSGTAEIASAPITPSQQLHGIDFDGNIVLGDNRLGRYIDHVFTHIDFGQTLQERNGYGQTSTDSVLILAQIFNKSLLIWPDNMDKTKRFKRV